MIIIIIIADYWLFVADFGVETLKTQVYFKWWNNNNNNCIVFFFCKWPWCLVLHSTFDFMIIPYVFNEIYKKQRIESNKWTNEQMIQRKIMIYQMINFLTFVLFSTRIEWLGRYSIVRNERNDNNNNNEGSHPEINRESTIFMLFFSFSLLSLSSIFCWFWICKEQNQYQKESKQIKTSCTIILCVVPYSIY